MSVDCGSGYPTNQTTPSSRAKSRDPVANRKTSYTKKTLSGFTRYPPTARFARDDTPVMVGTVCPVGRPFLAAMMRRRPESPPAKASSCATAGFAFPSGVAQFRGCDGSLALFCFPCSLTRAGSTRTCGNSSSASRRRGMARRGSCSFSSAREMIGSRCPSRGRCSMAATVSRGAAG